MVLAHEPQTARAYRPGLLHPPPVFGFPDSPAAWKARICQRIAAAQPLSLSFRTELPLLSL
jgi:hypothetical protein